MIVHKNCRMAYGVTRKVLLIGNWAIKVPNFDEWRTLLLGLLANMQEKTFSAMGEPDLCPVLFSLPGGWMIVMRRARVLTDEEFALWEEWDRRAWLDRGDWLIPAELKSDSFGYLDGRLVVVDYGN